MIFLSETFTGKRTVSLVRIVTVFPKRRKVHTEKRKTEAREAGSGLNMCAFLGSYAPTSQSQQLQIHKLDKSVLVILVYLSENWPFSTGGFPCDMI